MDDRNKYRFLQRLADQLNFLTSSCQQYDRGHKYEAIRIAQALRILFHDTKSSTSILTHIGSKDKVWLKASSEGASPNALEYYGMGILAIEVKDDGVATRKFEPALQREGIPHTALPIRYWWDTEVLVSTSMHPLRVAARSHYEPIRLKRSDIILNTANKDGGAHVDDNLPPEYEWLTSAGALAMFEVPINDQQLEPLADVHYVFLRQMAYEVLNSPDLIRLLEEPSGK